MGNTGVWNDDPGDDLGDEKEKRKHRKNVVSFLKGYKKRWEMDFFSFTKFGLMSRVGSRGRHSKCRPDKKELEIQRQVLKRIGF